MSVTSVSDDGCGDSFNGTPGAKKRKHGGNVAGKDAVGLKFKTVKFQSDREIVITG